MVLDSQASMEAYSMEVYRCAEKYPNFLSPERQLQLSPLARAGDQKAIQELCEANLRYVISVAKEYERRVESLLPLDDLIGSGNKGLVKAAIKFDGTKGSFITYARIWVHQGILSALAEEPSPYLIPIEKGGLLRKINKFVESYCELPRVSLWAQLGASSECLASIA